MADGSLLALLHLCDSLFPVGAFAQSDGLEGAVTLQLVCSEPDLRCWLNASLAESLVRCEGPAVGRAWNAASQCQWSDLAVVDAEVHALRPSSASRRASRAMGGRLLKTWQEVRPCVAGRLDEASRRLPEGVTLPVAFGLAAACAGIDRKATIAGYMYTRLAAATSAAMRLMPVGQSAAHKALASVLEHVPAAVDQIVSSDGALASFAPALDLAAMSQPHVESRLFRS
jgi:urease accessory protein